MEQFYKSDVFIDENAISKEKVFQLKEERKFNTPDFEKFLNNFKDGNIELVRDALSQEILPFFQDEHLLNFNDVMEIEILPVLVNILQQAPINFSDQISVSLYAFMTICSIISSEETEQYLDFLFQESINFQEILKLIFDSYLNGENIVVPYRIYAASLCMKICNTSFVSLFREFGFYELFCRYLLLSFDLIKDPSNQDGSDTGELYCENEILECVCNIIRNDKEHIAEEDLHIAFDIFNNILHFDSNNQCRPHLFETLCDFLIKEILDDPTSVIYFNEAGLFEESLRLIQESEIGVTHDYLLTPIFNLLGDVVGIDTKKPEAQIIKQIVQDIARKADPSSIWGYISEDIESLDNPKYDNLYTSVFILLNNIFTELEEVPEEFQKDEEQVGFIFETIIHILKTGRNTLTIEALRFFLALVRYSESKTLILFFLRDYDFESFFDVAAGCDFDITETFLEIIENILSVNGRMGFDESDEEITHTHSVSITEILNVEIPHYLSDLLINLDDANMKKAQEILDDYYPDYQPS